MGVTVWALHYAIIRTKTRTGRRPRRKNSIWFAWFVLGEKGLSDVQNIEGDKSSRPSIFYVRFCAATFVGRWIPILCPVSNIFPLKANKIRNWYWIESRVWIFRFPGLEDAYFSILALSISSCHPNPTLIPANPHKTPGTNGAIMSPLWTSVLIDLICQLHPIDQLSSCRSIDSIASKPWNQRSHNSEEDNITLLDLSEWSRIVNFSKRP